MKTHRVETTANPDTYPTFRALLNKPGAADFNLVRDR
jgi:hypothetical protein